MPKEKKQSADWYIAATHYLTAGFIIPFLISIAWTLIVTIINLRSGMVISGATINILNIFSVLLGAIAAWLGVMYSANYLKKTYIIGNKEKVVNIATIYMVAITGGYFLISFYWIRYRGGLITNNELIINGFNIFMRILLFYIFSKKYIKNTEQIEAGT